MRRIHRYFWVCSDRTENSRERGSIPFPCPLAAMYTALQGGRILEIDVIVTAVTLCYDGGHSFFRLLTNTLGCCAGRFVEVHFEKSE